MQLLKLYRPNPLYVKTPTHLAPCYLRSLAKTEAAVNTVEQLLGERQHVVVNRQLPERLVFGQQVVHALGGNALGRVPPGGGPELILEPGDRVIGDPDGPAVLPPAQARARLSDAQAKLALEREWIEGLATGKGARAVFGL